MKAERSCEGIHEGDPIHRRGDDVSQVQFEEPSVSNDGHFIYIANEGLDCMSKWLCSAHRGQHTSIRNTTEMKKKKLASSMACLRVFVAFLMSTEG